MGEIIGITFEDMENAKTKLNKGNEDNKNINVKLFAAIATLQVECLTSHLIQSQEAIKEQVGKVIKRMEDVDKVNTQIDYAMQRFQKIDSNYAATVKGKIDEYRLQNQAMQSSGNYGGVAGIGEFKNFNAIDLLAAGDINALDPTNKSSEQGYNGSYITQGTGTTVTEGKVEDPNFGAAGEEAAKSPDSIVGYIITAAEAGKRRELVNAANDIYHSAITNSSSKVEMYTKMFPVANDAAVYREGAAIIGHEGIGSLGVKLGAAGAIVGGGISIYKDVNNVSYDNEDKTKAVTVDPRLQL